MLAIWQQAFWLRFENSIHCVKRIFRGKTNFWRKCFLFTYGASWARSQGFQSVVLRVYQDILRKKSLKKYSDVYFLGIKKIGTSGRKTFRWVLKRGWHVSGDSLWGNITFWSKMSRLLLMAHVEHSTSNFSGQSNGQVVGSAFIEVNIFSSLLLHFDILGEISLNL